MRLHNDEEVFQELIELAARKYNLPSDAVRKDYFITLILRNLSQSDYLDKVVFKGGTSLSKCYPNSIERFSEDIDLTLIPEEGVTNKVISRELKKVEKLLIGDAYNDKIGAERSDKNKSSFVWFTDKYKEREKIKLEIGSSVRPHPFSKKILQSYIQDYLEEISEIEAINEFELNKIAINVLDIKRTFVDKIMSVKRHAVCGNLSEKVRHVYDVVKLIEMEEIKKFINDEKELKEIVQITKITDLEYLEKRDISQRYNPEEAYSFEVWKKELSGDVKINYENLHNTLLYTNEKQEWEKVEVVFEKINDILKKIGE